MNVEDRTYVRTTIYLAMGALAALAADKDSISDIIRQLGVAAEKVGGAKASQPSKANGGNARAAALTASRRSEIAKRAADKRWRSP